ncbi:MAG: DnaA regulatory inactivator Hda [Gammaproteobacteria bacterium]|jgi:DnaA family protein
MAEQLALNVGLRDSAVFETYYAGPNRPVVGALQALGLGRGELQIFLWGGAGAGKSHLLQAVCHLAAGEGPGAVFLPLRTLGVHGPDILDGMLGRGVICLDDVDAVLGDPQWERGLFNLINDLRLHEQPLLMSAALSPVHLRAGLPDLASRLQWGAVFQLHPLDDEAKLEALSQRAQARGLALPVEAGRYLLHRYPRDLGTLLGVLDRLDAASLAAQRRLTVPFIKQVLGGDL